MNYYQRHLGDYARDTGHLTLLEHGVYSVLLDWQYGTEKPLPAEPEGIHRICRAFSKNEKNAAERVRREFFDDAGWNKRAKLEMDKCSEASMKKRIGALKKHHPELAELQDEQVVQWCITTGYALDMQGRTTTTRARSKTPRRQDAILGGGGAASGEDGGLKIEDGGGTGQSDATHFPESVSDEAVIEFGKKFAGEPGSGTPMMADAWVMDFIRRINGRREWPRNWKRFMVSSWRSEWRKWSTSAKPLTGNGNFEKNGEKTAVSASVRVINLRNELRELEAIDECNRSSDLPPDRKMREKIAAIKSELKTIES
jgi:uncharacterized protein YdaU (DUF1376 family)